MSEIETHCIEYYITKYKEQYDIALKIKDAINQKYINIIVYAPVKSGKRVIAIILCLLYKMNSKKIKPYFISSLHAKADEKQRAELREYYGKKNVEPIIDKKNTKKLVQLLKNDLEEGNKIHMVLDELDYGSKKGGCLEIIWNYARINQDKITKILFSATPHEALKKFKNNREERTKELVYVPNESYHGIKKYLEEGRFISSEPFFKWTYNDFVVENQEGEEEKTWEDQVDFSKQGEACIKQLLNFTRDKSNKIHIAVLRLSKRLKKDRGTEFEAIKEVKKDLEKMVNSWPCCKGIKFRIKFISSKKEDEIAKWDDNEHWDDYEKTNAYLLIVNEMAKRSTEWRCTPYLAWYHTHRDDNISAFNTISQDQERIVYYDSSFEKQGFKGKDIKSLIYGSELVAKVSAGVLSINNYANDGIRRKKLSGNCNIKPQTRCIAKPDWDYKPNVREKQKIEKKHPKFLENITWNCKKKNPLNGETIVQKEWILPKKYYDTYIHLKGFRLANIRSSISNWLINVCINNDYLVEPPIARETQVKNSGGTNDKTKKRIIIYYQDGENNSENFKFYKKVNIGTKTIVKVNNTSIYD